MSAGQTIIKLLQVSVHRSRTPDVLLEKIVVERGMVIIREQYGRITKDSWFEEETGTAALWIFGSGRFSITEHGAGSGYIYLQTEFLTIMSILDMAASLGLIGINTGSILTFTRPGCEYNTTLDITLATENLARKITEWKVLEDYNGMD